MGVNLRGYLTADLPPLLGHAGHCAKVTTATITGNSDVACTCDYVIVGIHQRPVAIYQQPGAVADSWIEYTPCPVCSPSGPCEGHWISK
jgi:hypothetical protein